MHQFYFGNFAYLQLFLQCDFHDRNILTLLLSLFCLPLFQTSGTSCITRWKWISNYDINLPKVMKMFTNFFASQGNISSKYMANVFTFNRFVFGRRHTRKKIFIYLIFLLSVHNIINVSRHEQVCLMRLHFENIALTSKTQLH